MKQEILGKLEDFRNSLSTLKKELRANKPDTVNKKSLRKTADEIATMWVEELRSPLEYKFKLDTELIKKTAADMKQLHRLSMPSNLKSSYLKVISKVLKNFNDKYILPIKQTSFEIEKIFDLTKIIPTLSNNAESQYLKEAIECASSGHCRAAIVMGWCCAIDRIQRKIMANGFPNFNNASLKLKNQNKGEFKHWNKQFNISNVSELQRVFDKDLIIVLEGMKLIDGNQYQRLDVCLQYRNHSAHPGEAPIEETHVVTFFTDINKIILQNPKFCI